MDRRDNHRGAARAYFWWWSIFLVVIAITVTHGWKTSYGYRIVSGLTPSTVAPARQASAEQNQAEQNGVLALTSMHRASLAGKPVAFVRIPVLAVMGNKGFWIGSGTGYRILVAGNMSDTPSAYTTLAGVKDGDLVDLAGVVLPMPPAAQAKAMFNVSGSGSLMLAEEQVFVLASHINVVQDR